MKTSLNETRKIERGVLSGGQGDKLLLEAGMILDPTLRERVVWQQRAYEMIKLYGRKKLRMEIEGVHQKLFHSPEHSSFRQKIYQFFKLKD